MRYRITVTELLPVAGAVAKDTEAEGQQIFVTVVENKPDIEKLAAALKAPRIRKPRSKTA